MSNAESSQEKRQRARKLTIKLIGIALIAGLLVWISNYALLPMLLVILIIVSIGSLHYLLWGRQLLRQDRQARGLDEIENLVTGPVEVKRLAQLFLAEKLPASYRSRIVQELNQHAESDAEAKALLQRLASQK